MEKIIDFVKSLFSPKALLGFIIGIAIGFIADLIINITPNYEIHIGEFLAAILVSMYFWLYCTQVKIKLATPIKFLIAFLIVTLLSKGMWIIRHPIMLFVAGGQEKNYPPFDTLSYMISYGIICVFVGGLIETIWNIKKENSSQ
ncbi:MAG: hypothetical protein QNJ60_03710 [Xenococcaceae cyanobacterium MO_188.B19]|nr:hypothetical protein [Xenococcaceae cyanobacterium MO_188.B19]